MLKVDEMFVADQGIHLIKISSIQSPTMPVPDGHTFNRMLFNGFPSRTLCQQLRFLLLTPLEFLHALVMVVDSYAKNLLCTLLPHDELVQILLQ